jgi:membrane protease YdiL (CAAX protease family)
MNDHPNLPDAARCDAVHDAAPRRGTGGPAALLGVALAWLVLAMLGAAVAVLVAIGVLTWLGWVAPGRLEDGGLLALPLQQALMALGAVRRGRRVGGGDLQAGLGWLPVRRRRLVAGLVGCTLLVAVAHAGLSAWSADMREFYSKAVPALGGPRTGNAGYAAWIVATVVIGAPVAEELFFRGWLWAGLRRRWGAWRTGGATGLLFLLVHGLGGEWRQLAALVPVVVLLSLARELGGSVRASLMVHVVNNGLPAAGLIAPRLMG